MNLDGEVDLADVLRVRKEIIGLLLLLEGDQAAILD